MKDRATAIIGEQTLLTYTYFSGVTPTDVFSFVKVEIYNEDPRINLLATPIQTLLSSEIVRYGVGQYQYIMNIVSSPKSYFDKVYYIVNDGDPTTEVVQEVIIRDFNQTNIPHPLKGYAFNNPDLAANNGWGAIVTADELRYHYMWGMPMYSPDGDIWQDEQLDMYVQRAIGIIERDLNFTIMPKKYRYRPYGPFDVATQNTRSDLDQSWIPGVDFQWDEPYDFSRKMFNNFILLKLRHRPIQKLYSVLFRDPLGQAIADITTWSKPNYDMGSIQFFPHSGALANLPLYAGSPFFVSQAPQAIDDYPDAFFVDYDAGIDSAAVMNKKYPELFYLVAVVTALLFMPDYSEGRISGIASSSLGLEGVSESYATTASAENTVLSAKIRHYSEWLKNFLKENKRKYAGIQLIAL